MSSYESKWAQGQCGAIGSNLVEGYPLRAVCFLRPVFPWLIFP